MCSVIYLAAMQILSARNNVVRMESDKEYLFFNANLKSTWDELQEHYEAAYSVGAHFTSRNATEEELEAALQRVIQTTSRLEAGLSDLSQPMLQKWDAVLTDHGHPAASDIIESIIARQADFVSAFNDIATAWRDMAGFAQRKAAEKNVLLVMDEYTDEINRIQDQYQFFVQTESARYIEQEKARTIRTLVIAAGIILAGVLLSVTMMLRLSREFKVTVEVAERISDGDIQTEFHVGNRQDEMSHVKRSLKLLIDKLKGIFDSVFNLTDDLNRSTQQLVDDNQSRMNEVTAQVAELEQLADVVMQLQGYSGEVSQLAGNAIQNADDALSASDETSVTVSKTVAAIEALSSEVNNAVNELHSLQESTVEISSVLNVIQGIAEQTNLLALNAAIEAARAGDQGRGFAVVADEVRQLAKRTQDSTNEIQATIEGLTTGTQRVVATINQSQSNTAESVEWINRTGEVIKTIRHSLDTIRDNTTQTVHKLELQDGSLSEITENVAKVRQLAQSNSKRAEQSLELTDQLSDLSSDLQSSIGYFRKQ
ncbi:methyl-accepting chemotaxis protein [Reinekea marinisedimentorum]|nr:methyl-accepting chemotaxis protein [Reinekea marinisedimentorum]